METVGGAMTRISHIGGKAVIFQRGQWVFCQTGDPVPTPKEGCRCQGCGVVYKVDFIVPDHLWDRIRPLGKAPGGGLLCPRCIGDRVEGLGEFKVYHVEDAR